MFCMTHNPITMTYFPGTAIEMFQSEYRLYEYNFRLLRNIMLHSYKFILYKEKKLIVLYCDGNPQHSTKQVIRGKHTYYILDILFKLF